MCSKVLLNMLRLYKRNISPMLGPRCRFDPSCSEYMYIAVARYGALRGFWMGIKRLVRCNPFCRGGYDPVP